MQVLFPDVARQDIQIAISTRHEGSSIAPFHEANVAFHVGDDPNSVGNNRRALEATLDVDLPPVWLEQVHGNHVVSVRGSTDKPIEADASLTKESGLPLAIMTADCLPIMLWRDDASEVAAVHAGWRGLQNGIIGRCVDQMGRGSLSAFIGPGISACHYEVDEHVRQHFSNSAAFKPGRDGHYQFDMAEEAERQLAEVGVKTVLNMGVCTACDDRFYSYRQEGETGRMATLIWKS